MKKFYTSFQVAKICQVSPGSVVRWIHEGKLRAALTGGGHHRIGEDDLIEFLRQLNMPLPLELQPDRPLRLLIADDELSVRQLLKKMVENEFPQILIAEAEDGFAAGWKSNSFKPDIILLDVLMPGMNGIEVCRYLRSSEGLKDVIIIMISGVGGRDTMQEAIASGADAFLEKPFTQEDLKKILNREMSEKNRGKRIA